MPVSQTPRWKERVQTMDSPVDRIVLPKVQDASLAQDAEWCTVVCDDASRRMRFHDYHEIFKVPGLYERLFYETLECCSPSRVAHLLEDVFGDFSDELGDLRILDVGAGNGMVGDELMARGAERIVGVDIIPEAREAALRDRPEVYSQYLVADLTDLPEAQEERLRRERLNCLTVVAALGFGDIPPRAFLKGLDLIETPGWVAFNLKEDFIDERDTSGFSRLIRQLTFEHVLEPQAYRRYAHRRSVAGDPLHYVAMVARKLADVPDDFAAAFDD